MNSVSMIGTPQQHQLSDRISRLSLFPPSLIPSLEVWGLALSPMTPPEKAEVQGILTQEEQERGGRYRQLKDQQHFSLRRALLKVVLARELSLEAKDLPLQEDPYHKPQLGTDPHLQFNLSHTETHGIIAIHPNQAVGIDIERVRPLEAWESLLESFASPREKEWVINVDRFFMLWTLKEALLKYQGTGFLAERVPELDALPEEIGAGIYKSKFQEAILYSARWDEHWVTVCTSNKIKRGEALNAE